jgi:type II secretory pathway pseudopilin PulG
MAPRRRLLRSDEAGFSILESTIALALVFAVLVGLLGAFTAGARGVVTGRQRSAALALANEVLEGARGRDYGDVGHDFDSDPSLATDPLITGAAPNYLFTGVTPAEPLAASAVDAGATGGTVDNPLWPFSPHKFTSKREQTTFTTLVYVTVVTPASGDSYKRITTKVSWSPAQYATAARSVTLSTFLFHAGTPPDPKLLGTGESDAGSFAVTGTLAGINLSQLSLVFPYVSGGIDSGFVRSAKGLARSSTSELQLLSGTMSGCSLLGLLGSCDGVKAVADADNDSGTAPPDTDQQGPYSAASGTLGDAPVLSAALGSGTALAQASARSCWSCQPGGSLPVGDDDRLPYFYGTASGPATVAVDFLATGVQGRLLSVGSGCAANCATVTVDRDDSGANQRVSSTVAVAWPAVDLLPLLVGPAGYSGMVKVGALSASATANAGPGAAAPSVTGSAVNVRYWNGLSYTTVPVTPGVASSTTIPSVTFFAGGGFVTVSGSITSTKGVTSQTSAGGAITEASAGLTNWLFVDLNVDITGGTSLKLHFDYGRLAAHAVYEPGT